ncbi:MAG: PilZ domain-containing protein [Deltaproteobacteria bacterium]|nr:PilZ domain-containing protein [Deltaproteobacteria bacterium]
MTTATHEEMRIKQRFSVSLQAAGSLEGQGTAEHELRVSNLSATGARLHFDTTLHVRVGMRIALKIFIPHTILHVPTTGEIMWVTRQGNAVSFGVRFADILSETMVQQLIRKN